MGHLWGDVPALLLVAIVLSALVLPSASSSLLLRRVLHNDRLGRPRFPSGKRIDLYPRVLRANVLGFSKVASDVRPSHEREVSISIHRCFRGGGLIGVPGVGQTRDFPRMFQDGPSTLSVLDFEGAKARKDLIVSWTLDAGRLIWKARRLGATA
jgi:hypothetical protein